MIDTFPNTDLINKYGKFNDTPLAHAVIVGMPRVVKRLLELGANPNQKVAFQGTALHWAACKRNLKTQFSEEIYSLLIEAGANLQIPNEVGVTVANILKG